MSDPTSSTAGIPVTVIDAGVGNLGNLARALVRVGGRPEVTEDPERIRASRLLVLPGVGAFRPPRERLRGALEEALRAALDAGASLLGICVGFQLLFEASEEFGETDGLGLLPGRVVRLPEGRAEGGEDGDGPRIDLPHIGWNPLHDLSPSPLLAGIEAGDSVYFVHSFAPDDVPDAAVLARATHGRSFPAIAARGRVAGTQFHPEKSGPVGLRLLSNYLRNGLDHDPRPGGGEQAWS